MGETREEVEGTLVDLAGVGVDIVTIGQYLRPTTHHLPLPWIMGYDVEPLVTLESKRQLLAEAEASGWLLVFEHDAAVGFGRVVRDAKGYQLAP